MSDAVIFVSLALFWVYMERQNRWTGFAGALTSQYQIVREPDTGDSGSSGSSGSSGPTVSNAGTPNASVTPTAATVSPPSPVK